MQEGNEWGSNVHINHCTIYNSVEWVYQSAGWLKNTAITNSVIVNPYMFGFRALDVCGDDQDYNDFEDGLCDSPGGGLINGLTEVDSFGFVVPFTDYDRGLFISNNVYMYQDWLVDYYESCNWCKTQIQQRHPEELHHPSPMLGENEISFIDSTDGEGAKVFPRMNVMWDKIYTDDPGFVIQPLNEDSCKIFLEGRWGTGTDLDWPWDPYSGLVQKWPLTEDLSYSNEAYKTAAMGGFPLGDLNWFPDQKAAWQAQRSEEWQTINKWLDEGATAIEEISGVTPSKYALRQNYPNPFNPSTIIEYSVPLSGHVTLKVFNTIGQQVVTLFDGNQNAGSYKVTFDGTGLASGLYIYQLQSENITLTKKFVLMK